MKNYLININEYINYNYHLKLLINKFLKNKYNFKIYFQSNNKIMNDNKNYIIF